MTTTTQAYQSTVARLPRLLEAIERRSDIKRETAYFQSKIGEIKSPAELVSDARVYSYVLKAFGLSEMTYAKAMIRKVLEEGTDARESLANRLVDQRFRSLAQSFNFKRYGSAATSFENARGGTVERFMRLTVEEEAGRDNEGVRLAMNFERKAGAVTSAYGLLADKALLQVVKTALRLPDSFSSLDIDKQAQILSERIDIKDLAKPEKRGKFLQRFTALWDVANAQSTASSQGSLFGSTIGQNGLSAGVLQSIQSIRRAGR